MEKHIKDNFPGENTKRPFSQRILRVLSLVSSNLGIENIILKFSRSKVATIGLNGCLTEAKV